MLVDWYELRVALSRFSLSRKRREELVGILRNDVPPESFVQKQQYISMKLLNSMHLYMATWGRRTVGVVTLKRWQFLGCSMCTCIAIRGRAGSLLTRLVIVETIVY